MYNITYNININIPARNYVCTHAKKKIFFTQSWTCAWMHICMKCKMYWQAAKLGGLTTRSVLDVQQFVAYLCFSSLSYALLMSKLS